MKDTLARVRKALTGAFLVAVGVVFAWDQQIVEWVEGKGEFEWRSLLGAVISAVIAYFAVYYVKNKPKPE